MADVYATITDADPALAAQIAEVLELRAADPQQAAMRRGYLGDITFPEGASVLEVGCGTGAVTRELAAWPGVVEVTGLDPSPTFLGHARRHDPPGNARFVEGDARSLQFQDRSFDVVVFHTTLCHVPGPELALGEAARVLRPAAGWPSSTATAAAAPVSSSGTSPTPAWWRCSPTETPLDLGAHSKVYPLGMALTVSALADTVGLSADTVRYYERVGLLPEPARSAAGYRLYDQAAVGRLRLIKGAQRAGLRLREIGELLQVADKGLCPCGHTETLLRGRLVEVRAELDRLRGLEAELSRLLEPQPAPACPEPQPVTAAAAWWCDPDCTDPCPPPEGR